MLQWDGVMRFVIVLALLIAIVIVLFALQNSALVTISFLSLQYNASCPDFGRSVSFKFACRHTHLNPYSIKKKF
jgi:hypothetical protein